MLPYAGKLFPDLVAAPGPAGRNVPPEDYVAGLLTRLPDIVRQIEESAAIFRPAQSAIENLGKITGVETTGTDRLIRTAARIQGERFPILLKLIPPHFDCIIDQPVIGLNTIQECKKAGVRGIIVIAERTIIVDKATTVQAADESRIFIYALPPLWLAGADPRYRDLLHL